MTAKTSVLVVDDDTTMREILDFYLQSQGFVVSIAEDGGRAIQLMQAKQYDLVITDMEMGSINGLEVVRFAKTYRPDIFVIMMTGNYEVELRKDAFRLGVDDFLHKPFDLSSLVRRLAKEFMDSTNTFDKLDEIECANKLLSSCHRKQARGSAMTHSGSAGWKLEECS